MTEVEYLKCKLEDTEKAFDRLHKKHMELLKQQGELEKENEELKSELSEKDIQLDFLKAENIHVSNLVNENEQLKIENKHFRKVFGNKYDAYIYGKIGGNVNEL